MKKTKPNKPKSIEERFNAGMARGWIRVGKYTFCEYLDDKDKPCLWWEHESGEAMALSKKNLDKIFKGWF